MTHRLGKSKLSFRIEVILCPIGYRTGSLANELEPEVCAYAPRVA